MADTLTDTRVLTYVAKHDPIGAFVPLQNRRRYIVIRYMDGKFCWVCGAFSSMSAAEKRAAYLNERGIA